MTSEFFQIIIAVAKDCNIPIVLIGGLALPAYNVARSTLDIDMCINVETQEVLNRFINALKEKNIKTLQKPKINHNLFAVFGRNNEAEIWLMPCDAFSWDIKMVERIHQFFGDIFVLSIEDYLLTKIARADRSSIDIDDILQILLANKDKLDWEYFNYRLNWIDLKEDFIELLKNISLDYEDNLRIEVKEILDEFEKVNGKLL